MGGVLFLLLFSIAARLVSQGKWLFRCIDGAGKLFCGIKKLEFLLFLGGNFELIFLVILSANANANMLSALK